MSGVDELVAALAWLNAGVWVVVGVRMQRYRMRYGTLASEAMVALLVACLAAAIGGSLSALVYPGWITPGLSQTFASAWRAAMLTAGLYAFWATRRGQAPR